MSPFLIPRDCWCVYVYLVHGRECVFNTWNVRTRCGEFRPQENSICTDDTYYYHYIAVVLVVLRLRGKGWYYIFFSSFRRCTRDFENIYEKSNDNFLHVAFFLGWQIAPHDLCQLFSENIITCFFVPCTRGKSQILCIQSRVNITSAYSHVITKNVHLKTKVKVPEMKWNLQI